MLISKIKILVVILILSFVNVSCTNVKKAFDPEKKDSSEEFLVEKKTPLSMPPDFDKLPLPKSSEIKAQDALASVKAETLIAQQYKVRAESDTSKKDKPKSKPKGF